MLSKSHSSADQLRVVLLVEPSADQWQQGPLVVKICCPDESVLKNSFRGSIKNRVYLLGLLAKIKVFGVLPAHWPLIL